MINPKLKEAEYELEYAQSGSDGLAKIHPDRAIIVD
jgi:hypothetical protein